MSDIGDLLERVHDPQRFKTFTTGFTERIRLDVQQQALRTTVSRDVAARFPDVVPGCDVTTRTMRLWLEPPDLSRIEEHQGEEQTVLVMDGGSWMRIEPGRGALVNTAPSHPAGSHRVEAMLDPALILWATTIARVERTIHDQRTAWRVEAHPRAPEAHQLALAGLTMGSDSVSLTVDRDTGVALEVVEYFHGHLLRRQCFHNPRFDQPIERDLFRVDPPDGIPVEFTTDGPTLHSMSAADAAAKVGFGIFHPSVPSGWTASVDLSPGSAFNRIRPAVFIQMIDSDGTAYITIEESDTRLADPEVDWIPIDLGGHDAWLADTVGDIIQIDLMIEGTTISTTSNQPVEFVTSVLAGMVRVEPVG